jgi:hypothetical protein
MPALPSCATRSRTLGCARSRARPPPWPRPSGGRNWLRESKDPGPLGSGSGCKSPAGRHRQCGGEWSAGRSAASRDGRRALIARSQDLPVGLLNAVRGPEYSLGRPAPAGRLPLARARMRRIPYCHRTPRTRTTASGSVPNGKHGPDPRSPFIGNGGGRPSFLRIKRNDRLPLSREAIVFFRIRRAMMPAGRAPARGRSLMVARLVTLDRDLPLPTAVGIDVRSKVRGRRPESPRLAASRRSPNLTYDLAEGEWTGRPSRRRSMVAGARAPFGDLGTGASRHHSELVLIASLQR